MQAKATAGVSYVVHSESRQAGADGMACLPHLGAPGKSSAASRCGGALPWLQAAIASSLHCVSALFPTPCPQCTSRQACTRWRARMWTLLCRHLARRCVRAWLGARSLCAASWAPLTTLPRPASAAHAPQPTAAAVLPLREGEQRMKEYVLAPGGRAALLARQGGRLEQAPRGALGLEALLQDRSFACLHYRLDAEGRLHPVSATADAQPERRAAGSAGPVLEDGGAAAAGPAAAAGSGACGVEQSDVQLGVMVRKGVGGTCPLR